MKNFSFERKKYLKKISTVLSFQLIPILVSIVAIPLNIDHLGLEIWGIYNLSVTFFFLIMYFNLGIGQAVIRITSEQLSNNNKENEINTVKVGFLINILSSIFIAFILFSISLYIISSFNIKIINIKALFYLSVINSLIYLTISFFRSIFEAKGNFFIISFIRSIISSLIISSPLFFDVNNIHFTGYLLFIVLSFISIFMFIYLNKEYRFFKLPFNFIKNSFQIIKEGFSISVISLIYPVFIYLDRYLISFFFRIILCRYIY